MVRHRRNSARGCPFGETYAARDYRLRLYPAGHVLGSAMVHVETEAGESLLYTGDFKMRQGLAAEAIEIPQADVLVMETTFGNPNYVFPPQAETHAQIHDFCRCALADGEVPVLLAYSLGQGAGSVDAAQGCRASADGASNHRRTQRGLPRTWGGLAGDPAARFPEHGGLCRRHATVGRAQAA